MHGGPPGSSAHGILQARVLEGAVISFSRGSSQLWDQTHVSCITGSFFTIWDTRDTQKNIYFCLNIMINIICFIPSPAEKKLSVGPQKVCTRIY